MNSVVELQQDRAEAIHELAGYLLASESGVTRSIADKISELAALIQEDLLIALDAS
ncbi:hypothetical protein [Modicisalibacter xianhensis]|uniref:Uncharacterized protein n=1 Tax=Modicisalibacter xianhensis TaxID=442341 RepID=A0A1I3GKN3_9GAMM|nr:hypothetical protein [Halomonas xianhensis]SFI24034.1 hypothetical protein SAMN04487959_1343 [Halomonas xianhensis]